MYVCKQDTILGHERIPRVHAYRLDLGTSQFLKLRTIDSEALCPLALPNKLASKNKVKIVVTVGFTSESFGWSL